MSGLWPNAAHVARREYLVRVRGRAFLITTVLLALAVVVVALLPVLLQASGVVGEPAAIAIDVRVDDLPSDPVATVQATLTRAAESGASATRTEDPAAAADAVREGRLDGLLTITRGADGELAFEYLSSASPTSLTRTLVTQAAGLLAVSDRLARAGIAPTESAALFRPPAFTAVQSDPEARPEEDYGPALLAAYVIVILTFMAILTYGNWVAQSVAEEKSNRVMELLITSATPRQLLTGKVLGTGAAGLTQYLAILVAAGVGLSAGGPVADSLNLRGEAAFRLPSLEPWMLPAFVAFFLLGFVLYSTLYAAAGSMVSRVEDVQQAAGPLIFLAMAGYFVSFTALNDPEAGWVAGLSLVPFFSPYLMPMRMLLTGVEAT
ncbi:MAG: ABC transporter permease, partial [Chloroflexota bacterium]